MTDELFRNDSYLEACTATVVRAGDGRVILDRTVFYPTGGGQPGDTGTLRWQAGGTEAVAEVIDTVYGEQREITHVLAADAPLPLPGTEVHAAIDWERRYRHMRMHTALHLLGAAAEHRARARA